MICKLSSVTENSLLYHHAPRSHHICLNGNWWQQLRQSVNKRESGAKSHQLIRTAFFPFILLQFSITVVHKYTKIHSSLGCEKDDLHRNVFVCVCSYEDLGLELSAAGDACRSTVTAMRSTFKSLVIQDLFFLPFMEGMFFDVSECHTFTN